MKGVRQIKTGANFWTYLLIAFVVFTAGAIGSYFYFKPRLALELPFIADITAKEKAKKYPWGKEKTVEEIFTAGEGKELIDDTIITGIENSVKKNLKSYDVKIIAVSIDKDGVFYIDLSSELKKSFKGDASEEYDIIEGLYKSLKENMPDITAIKILMDGKNTDSLGGHMDLSAPLAGKVFEDSYR
ncbi:MAG: GerMN domain-containing protein [Nitrospirae bacterium]|nr:GerMN domain-containing protein [Nitrospirota bacterium]MBI4838154.1 GerMN domain-containing protein [Nitrospirota bacterium]